MRLPHTPCGDPGSLPAFEQQFFVWDLDRLGLHLKCQGYTSFMAMLKTSQLHIHPALRDRALF